LFTVSCFLKAIRQHNKELNNNIVCYTATNVSTDVQLITFLINTCQCLMLVSRTNQNRYLIS